MPLADCKICIDHLLPEMIDRYGREGKHDDRLIKEKGLKGYLQDFILQNFNEFEGHNLYEAQDKVMEFFDFIFSLDKIDMSEANMNLEWHGFSESYPDLKYYENKKGESET